METDFRKFSIAFVALFVAACTTLEPVPEPGQDPGIDNGGTAQTWSVNGNVQKGPFTQGTSITIQALDESGKTNVNLLTTLESDRMVALVKAWEDAPWRNLILPE